MEDASVVIRGAAALAVVALAACGRGAAPQQAPVVVGTHAARLVAAPLAQPNAPPRIVRVWLSEDSVGAGDVLRGHVTTTTNVASLEVRLGPKSAPLKRTTFGQFEGTYRIPKVPSFLRRSYNVDVIARNAAGTQAQTQVTISYR